MEKLACLCLALLLGLAGCAQNGHDGQGAPSVGHLHATAKPMAEPGTLSGELAIAYLGYNGGGNFILDEEVAGFQRLHPDVHIKVYQDGIDVEEGFVEKITVGLVGGAPIGIVESSFLN